MRWRDILTLSKDILDQFKNVMDDKAIKEGLTEAGGLLALIGIGIKACEDIHKSLQDPAERAYSSLLKYILKSLNDSIKEIERLKNDENFKKDDLINILRPFEKASNFDSSSDWNSSLLNHVVIDQLRSKIEAYLHGKGYDEQLISSFLRMFNLKIENNANSDEDLIEFRKWWTVQEQNKDVLGYLKQMDDIKNYVGIDKKPLQRYYIDHDAVWITFRTDKEEDTWYWGDDTIREKHQKDVKNVKDVIKEKLIDQDRTKDLVVAASFGIGKTSMTMIIASKYASICLDRGLHNYIPILVFLKHGFRTEYNHETLDNVLTKIVAPEKNKESINRRILLILDGLDEYDKEENLISKLDALHEKYQNMKIMITTRLDDKVIHKQGYIRLRVGERYVRLLSFTKEQIGNFFKNYGVVINLKNYGIISEGEQLTYERAYELNLPVEEMTKPLFLWIFSYLEMNTDFKIESKVNWTDKMVRSWIYLIFFHHVIGGKYKDTYADDSWKTSYIYEKKALRLIAALKEKYSDNLTWRLVDGEMNNLQTSLDTFDDTIKSEPSYFFYLKSTTRGKLVDFIHKSFKEYLLAEYYIESLLEDKVKHLNIRTPSEETLMFLDGLINLLKSKDEDVQKFISQDDTSLLHSFNFHQGREKAIKQLKDITPKTIGDDSLIFCRTMNSLKTVEIENIWRNADLFSNWISLYILNTLDNAMQVNKNRLTKLIMYSSNPELRHLLPGYIKKLMKVDLSEIDLEDSVFRVSNLIDAIISQSDLSHVDLSGANLSGANLSGANLRDAIFSYTLGLPISKEDARLRGAIFE